MAAELMYWLPPSRMKQSGKATTTGGMHCSPISRSSRSGRFSRKPAQFVLRKATGQPRCCTHPVASVSVADQAPLFRDKAVPHTKDRYLIEARTFSCGNQVEKRLFVHAGRYVPRYDLIAIDNDVLDSFREVG